MEANSVDSVVTDPPYGLRFMGKKWDYDVPSVEVWKEVLRVLKPGGHLLSFCGTRTYHRMVVRIEDAGFEIRDQIMWLYGQGFPKSLDISKALDKMAGAEREVIGSYKATGTARNSKNIGAKTHAAIGEYERDTDRIYQTAPATEAAKQWAGWGTALKPAWEVICLARKPISEKNIAENVLKWGVGGINVDGCRIGVSEDDPNKRRATGITPPGEVDSIFGVGNSKRPATLTTGRFPANLLLDEEAAAAIGEPSRFFYCAKVSAAERNAGLERMPAKFLATMGNGIGEREHDPENPRAYAKNFHPTVKPIKLMEYLCKLVTPPGGVVLDPFMGSGSTGVAAKRLGFSFIGIEREYEYHSIASARISSIPETSRESKIEAI